MDCAFFRKKTSYRLHMQYKGSSVQIFLPFISGFKKKKRNKIYNTSLKRYGETGSPWPAPISRLKHWVVLPPFMTHDC